MSQTVVKLGFVPKDRGEYDATAKYYKDNIVQYEGSSYIADPVGYDPSTPESAYNEGVAPWTDDPHTLNSGWRVFASGNNQFATGENVSDLSIATDEDFVEPDSTKRVKLPNVGAIADVYGSYEENPEWIYVVLDSEKHILGGFKANGDFEYASGVPKPIREHIIRQIEALGNDYNVSKWRTSTTTVKVYDVNEGWTQIEYDSSALLYNSETTYNINDTCNVTGDTEHSYKSLAHQQGNAPATSHTEQRVTEKLSLTEAIAKIPSDILDGFVAGQTIVFVDENNNVQRAELKNDGTFSLSNPYEAVDPEGRLELGIDENNVIISERKADGTLVENVGIETNRLDLTPSGMDAFQQALKDAGFSPGGGGDLSDLITKKGKNPAIIPEPRCAVLNILSDIDLTALSKSDMGGIQKLNYDVKVQVEFFDGQGIYFKKWALIGGQGNSSMIFEKKNISLKIFDTEDVEGKKKKWGKGDTFGIKFGDWVMQTSFHLKAYHTDYIRGAAVAAYQLANEVYKTRGSYEDRPWKKALIDFSSILSTTPMGLSAEGISDVSLQIDNGARCMPDGFPVIVYQQGEFYGIFSWQIKKDAANYHMEEDNKKHIHLDGKLTVNTFWGGNINWTEFEVRVPEDLVCMDGSDYDGDFPDELIDSTSAYYNPSDSAHVKSAQVKLAIQNLANRINEINSYASSLEIPTPRPEYPTATLGDYAGLYKTTTSYGRFVWVYDETSMHFYLSLHALNENHPVSDTEYWLEIDEYINQIKELIETYFDYKNLADYQIINMACGDTDGFGKNWQWITYDGTKWYVCQYDKDMAFGNQWTGMFTSPIRNGWINNDKNMPSGLAISYYQIEHKNRWNEMREAGIFTTEHIKSLLTNWVNRIGEDNYRREWERWPEAPCNRDSHINFDYWRFDGGFSDGIPATYSIWDDATSYNIGDKVWFTFPGNLNKYVRFEAIANNINQQPLTEGYSVYPTTMGYRDSIWRYFKYIEETVAYQDAFINN